MLYGCVTWSLRACHCDTLRRAHHNFLTRCIDWRKGNRAGHTIPSLNKLIETGSESIEVIIRRKVDPVREVCGPHGGHEPAGVRGVRRTRERRGLRWGLGKRVDRVFLDDLKRFGINANQWTTAAQERGNDVRRWNKRWKVSWSNGSLQRKLGLGYGMH